MQRKWLGIAEGWRVIDESISRLDYRSPEQLLAKQANFGPGSSQAAITASREERQYIAQRHNFVGTKLPGCSNSPRDATTGRGRISSR
jgi:hypothetical protein